MEKRDEYDLTLVGLIRQGDRLALNTLFSLHYQRLCNFAFTFLNNREDAEECVADVFVTIWKCRERILIDKNVRAYLFVSVKNTAQAYLRNRSNAMESLDYLDLPSAETPLSRIEYEEIGNRITNAMHTLPPRCRRIFFMSRMEGYSYQEIATLLDLSVHTVENQIVKALKILRLRFTNLHSAEPAIPVT
jgi:RNA polymerase sigma-70 factor (ECF subfamily)